MKLALFDLDHTLLPLDSDYSWGQFTVELGWRDAVTHTQTNQAFYEQYCAGTLNIADHVRFSTESLREQGMAAAHAAHERFMRDIIRPAMRPAAIDLVANYRQAGYATLLVTATNAFVTRPIAQAFGVDELIAIDLVNDLPLLERVHEPVATNPDARLLDIATQRGWRILNLFE
jgi:phosphoserine phosphatase